MAIAVRLLLLSAVFLLFISQVSSNGYVSNDITEGNQAEVRGGNRRLLLQIDCDGLCGTRCSLHSRPNVCLRACGTCCLRCKCVPPGTSGNREVCGSCYTDMKTHGNQTKCP